MTKADSDRQSPDIDQAWLGFQSITSPAQLTALIVMELLVCCFALVSATSRDAGLRQLARSRAESLARRWNRTHAPSLSDANPDLLRNFIFVRYALSRLGLRDAALDAQIRTAAKRFSARDLLASTLSASLLRNDLSYRCDCGLENLRRANVLPAMSEALHIQTRYRVWMEALANTYVGERCGILFGARHADLLKWLPVMRPYPADDEDEEVMRDALFAVTHLRYT